MQVNYLLYIQPRADKWDRCTEVLQWLTAEIKANEPDVLAYSIRETGGWEDGLQTFFAHMMYVLPYPLPTTGAVRAFILLVES